jgi:hypothetical protein
MHRIGVRSEANLSKVSRLGNGCSGRTARPLPAEPHCIDGIAVGQPTH